jgi:hypothetical protein
MADDFEQYKVKSGSGASGGNMGNMKPRFSFKIPGGSMSVGEEKSGLKTPEEIQQELDLKRQGGIKSPAEINQMLDLKKREGQVAIQTAKEKETALNQSKLKRAGVNLSVFVKTLNELPAESGLPGLIQGRVRQAEAMLPIGKEPAKINAYINGVNALRNQVARSLGDMGRIPIQELQTAIKIIPQVTDNKETQKAKVKFLVGFLKANGANFDAEDQKLFDDFIGEDAKTTDMPNAPIATNPKTGEKIIFMNGRWTPYAK